MSPLPTAVNVAVVLFRIVMLVVVLLLFFFAAS